MLPPVKCIVLNKTHKIAVESPVAPEIATNFFMSKIFND